MTPQLPNLYEILVNTFRTIITQFQAFVPNFITALIVLLIGILVSRIVASVVKKVLRTAGFDKLGDKLNEIDFIRQLQTEIKLSEIVATIVKYFLLLAFINQATETLGVAAISDMVKSLVNFIPKLIAAAIMLQVGILVADALKQLVITLCASFKIASGRLLGAVVFFFFLIITIISALGQAGINTELLESSFNLLVGGVIFAFAIGYGLASRDVMANLVSSFYSKKRFLEGQRIRVEGIVGTIVSIDTISLTLQTDKSKVTIPMQLLQNKPVEFLDK
jgi:hypothetical protein